MRILGIDPGYAILGYGVLDKIGNKFVTVAYGSITTDSKMEMPERLVALYDGLTEIIQTYKPDEASIEELFSITTQRRRFWSVRQEALPFLPVRSRD